MLACRTSRHRLRCQSAASWRAGFRTSAASPASRRPTPPRPIPISSKPKPQISKPPKITPKPHTYPSPSYPPPSSPSPPPHTPPSDKKLITPSLAGALALAVVFGYFVSVSVFSRSQGEEGDEALVDPLTSGRGGGGGGDHSACCAVPTGRPTSLAGISAAQFDRELDYEESKTGVTKLREKLAGRAVGHVLEVAVGTGRNFDLYNWESLARASTAKNDSTATAAAAAPVGVGVASGKAGGKKKDAPPRPEAEGEMLSFTGLDIAKDMLDVASTKLTKQILPSLAPATPLSSPPTVSVLRNEADEVTAGAISFLPNDAIRLVKTNALSYLPPPPPPPPPSPAAGPGPEKQKKYDTVIQTFGLCSVSDPRAVLSNLASVLKPDTGRIILLEHGRGTWGVVNWWLDRHAPEHFRKYGCWWNRDLEGIVREAAGGGEGGVPGLEVVKIERPGYQGGTVLWIELKVVGR